MIQGDRGSINYRDEIVRKLIHLCSLSIPVVYYFISKASAILILSIVTIAALAIDLSRYFFPSVSRLFYTIFGFLLRDHEIDKQKKNLNGATYVLISALICVIIFPKIIFLTAFSILIISDSLAALIGRKYGRHKFLSKSLEGTLTFFISAIVVVLFTPKIEGLFLEYIIGIAAAAGGAIIENISFGFADDNLSVPVSIGAIIWLMYLIFLPSLHLI